MRFLSRSLRSRLGMRTEQRITGLGWPCVHGFRVSLRSRVAVVLAFTGSGRPCVHGLRPSLRFLGVRAAPPLPTVGGAVRPPGAPPAALCPGRGPRPAAARWSFLPRARAPPRCGLPLGGRCPCGACGSRLGRAPFPAGTLGPRGQGLAAPSPVLPPTGGLRPPFPLAFSAGLALGWKGGLLPPLQSSSPVGGVPPPNPLLFAVVQALPLRGMDKRMSGLVFVSDLCRRDKVHVKWVTINVRLSRAFAPLELQEKKGVLNKGAKALDRRTDISPTLTPPLPPTPSHSPRG